MRNEVYKVGKLNGTVAGKNPFADIENTVLTERIMRRIIHTSRKLEGNEQNAVLPVYRLSNGKITDMYDIHIGKPDANDIFSFLSIKLQ